MAVIAEVVTGLATPLFNLVDKLFTSDEERNAAKMKVLELEQNGQLEGMKTQLSAIVTEAQSADPWTSRARPSFLYVMYVIILWSIPMGILSAFRKDMADNITSGMTGYLGAIPEALWALFGTGYLGYAAMRQWGKVKGVDR